MQELDLFFYTAVPQMQLLYSQSQVERCPLLVEFRGSNKRHHTNPHLAAMCAPLRSS